MLSLLAAAYRAKPCFPLFRSVSYLYFAAASFNEIRQRLFAKADDGKDWAWAGFLGADDDLLSGAVGEAVARVDRAQADPDEGVAGFESWVTSTIRPRNLAGLGERADHLLGCDLDLLVARSSLVGLSRAAMIDSLPRLRGQF